MSKKPSKVKYASLLLIAMALAGAGWYAANNQTTGPSQTTASSLATKSTVTSGSFTGLPELAVKPQPAEITFNGCPPQGQGGDSTLNLLKNRVDESTNYYTVSIDAILSLTWPNAVERKHRSNWSTQDNASISRYEGIPLAVEGFLVDSKEEGKESTNCQINDHADHDYHIWLVKNPEDNRSSSIVVEVTPRVRATHPSWTLSAIRDITQEKDRVRISGWFMFDQEHPEQIGKTRGTLWEIHPIIRIEVLKAGQWTELSISGELWESLPPAQSVIILLGIINIRHEDDHINVHVF